MVFRLLPFSSVEWKGPGWLPAACELCGSGQVPFLPRSSDLPTLETEKITPTRLEELVWEGTAVPQAETPGA